MKQIKCRICGHQWTPRIKKPKTCPRCKNYLNRKENNVPIRKKNVSAA